MTTLDDIFGQDAAIDAIKSAYKLDRLPHGLIFSGPAGVGKGTAARALGALFLCEQPRQLAACGKCASCRVLEADNHPDYHVIYRQLARLDRDVKAKELAVDVVRGFLIAKAANKSVLGTGKVFVVEEADLMNPSAQNSMLKTLEEPHGRTLIILLTDQPDALLPTIRSRCQRVSFAALDEKLVREQLAKRGVAKDVATSAARFAGGSLGLALRWIEDGVIGRAEELTKMLEQIASGRAVAGLHEWFKASAEAYAAKQLERDELASKDQATREGAVLYLKLAADFFRRRLGQLPSEPDTLEQSCTAIDRLVRAETYLESNVNIPLVLQQLAVSLAPT